MDPMDTSMDTSLDSTLKDDGGGGGSSGVGGGAAALLGVDPKFVDELTSQELLQLSNDERTKLLEEIHGVSSMAEPERQDMVQKCMEQLAEQIDLVSDQDPIKEAFVRGLQLRSSFVTDSQLWLKFLRATFFRPELAARRLMGYLSLCSSYFGEDALMRPIRASDLDTNEERLIRDGESQILAGRDIPLGRRVIVQVGGFKTGPACTVANRVRSALYKTCTLTPS
jgi:hypothetical protein